MSFAHSSLEPTVASRPGWAVLDRVGLCRASQPNSAAYIWNLCKAVAVAPQVSTEWPVPPSGVSVPGHGHGSATLGTSLEWDAAQRHMGGSKASRPLLFEAVPMGGHFRIGRALSFRGRPVPRTNANRLAGHLKGKKLKRKKEKLAREN